ncbi:MAG: NUDIX domain-containing protein [Bacilli bacterium]|nr:NUDIX domain-containing protein [Bacilli bacterium]
MKMHFCATACIVDKNNKKILFIHHKKLNKWLFVGGHIEENEDPETAVCREVKEETNLDITLLGERYPRQEDFIKPFALQRNVIDENHVHMDIFYIALANNIEQLETNEREVLNHRWFSKEETESNDFDTFPEKKQMAIDVLNYIDTL